MGLKRSSADFFARTLLHAGVRRWPALSVRALAGGALALVLLVSSCLNARCEVLCSVPALLTACGCADATQGHAAMTSMPGMGSSTTHSVVKHPVQDTRNSIASSPACSHGAHALDAELSGFTSPGLQDLHVAPLSEARVALVAFDVSRRVLAPPLVLPMTPLAQTTTLRI